MGSKAPITNIEEIQDLLEAISDSFYVNLTFNRERAIRTITEDGMSDEHAALIVRSVNAGVKSALKTIEELDGSIHFKTRGITAVLSGDLVRGMFDDINS